MRCTSCGFENPADGSFCGECAAPLANTLSCPSCGKANPAKQKFCNGCGGPLRKSTERSAPPDPRAYTPKHLAEKILQSKSALEGERKQVTVLFADVKGSMELAEQLDPEAWHEILDRFFQILTDGVHRFEGTVNQYTGDGIMALFGAPIAHEDHAQRACYAALHLKDELRRYSDELRLTRGLNFSVRIGLNSGEVVVGKIGEDLRMDYTAQGHTVGLAARMEQIAQAGSVYLTEHTAKLVEGMFTLQDVGRMTVKGVKEPLGVYELRGVGRLRTKLEVSRARGFSRFVGRDGEMAVLQSALGKALEGQGQIVGIVGEAGVGKSRLCLEFVERCRAKGIFVNEGHCLAHGKAIPYLPVLELWRSYFGIAERDSDEEARRKIAGTLLLLGEDFLDVLPLVFEFLGVADPERPAPSMEPEQKQRRMTEFLRRVVRLQSGRAPMVILIDDLHWIDRASDEVVAQLADAIEGARSMFLVNFRPEYDGAWMKSSHYQQLPLLPLGPEGIEAMLGELLGANPSVKELKSRIRERTGGNPFFIEEIVQSLAESGALEGARGSQRMVQPLDAVSIPPTVHVVLAARIDRLPDREKALLQTASVIGRKFSELVLKKVAGLAETELVASLVVLSRGEFVHQESLYPEVEYAFKHPLTQEAAYRSQLSERRKEIHAAVAGAIHDSYPDQLEERASELAYHWENAGDALEAARWHRRAARWTEDTDPSESLRRWHKVRALLADAAISPETTSLRMQACRGILSAYWRVGGSEVDSVFAEGKALAEQAGDLRLLAILFDLYGNAKGTAGDLRAYRKHTSEALRLAERTDDPVIQAVIASDPHPFCWTGRLREAVRLTEKAIALGPEDLSLGQELMGISAYLAGLMFRGMALVEMGRLEEATSDLDRASAHPAEHPSPFIWAGAWHVVRAYRSGDLSAALRHAGRALERAEEVGGRFYQVLVQVVLGIALVANHEWRAAEEAERRALALARESGVGFGMTAWALCFLAEAKLGQGEPRTALELADEALVDARQSGGRLFEMDALLTRARALLDSEGASCGAEVESTLADASALIDETGARCREPIVREVSAELARLRGDEATRERELREAYRLFVEMGATGHAERIAPLLAESAR
jgi:class 3 adenylate cyclase/tetratricopeptide (TPR) repeat protein